MSMKIAYKHDSDDIKAFVNVGLRLTRRPRSRRSFEWVAL